MKIESYCLLPLSRGLWARVSLSAAARVGACKWSALKAPRTFYAVRTPTINGKKKTIYLHREILEASPSAQVDHKDGDGLNNLDNNLRFCNNSQNQRNRGADRDTCSGFRGVRKSLGRWTAYVVINKKHRHLGQFDTAEEAARARDKVALELHGVFARLNFPTK